MRRRVIFLVFGLAITLDARAGEQSFPLVAAQECRPRAGFGTDLPDGVHRVKLEIHPEQPNRMTILGPEAKRIDRPERFQGTNFYPAAILLVGELVSGS
jgi:hypothetical protein